MYNYLIWPGAYSFAQEISLFLKFFKEQIELLEKKLE
jgi:hypothetical protein